MATDPVKRHEAGRRRTAHGKMHVTFVIHPHLARESPVVGVWRQELDVDNWVAASMKALGVPYNQQRAMSPYLVNALRGSSKTPSKAGAGVPDLSVERWVDERSRSPIPVLIEDKLGRSKLSVEANGFIKQDDRSISGFASNGALYYARSVLDAGSYEEAVAIGVAGDDEENVAIQVLYVYGSGEKSYKVISGVSSFDFLESQRAFSNFLNHARLSDEERHEILVRSRADLQRNAKKLNKLMHDLNITAAQRVLYVSGMLLAMQDIADGDVYDPGLVPEDLRGSGLAGRRDGELVVHRISNYLDSKEVPADKKRLMLASFVEISKDADRDVPHEFENGQWREISTRIPGKSSATKRVFTFLYEYVYRAIDGTAGHLDIMGEMYSEFLKYALGDGKEIGIVLTPPYVTKMMTEILDVNEDCRVMDLAAGSAGFLISAMDTMVQRSREKHGAGTKAAQDAEARIKAEQLLGVELNAEMYALATTNMILRGDGSSRIEKADTFKHPPRLYSDFRANRMLLNPPFSYRENGMPFLEFGLRHMEIGGRAAIIIQDSAGSGQALASNARILAQNQLVASIKMPPDLFQPMAGVQTSIYIVEHTGRPHDFEKPVRFIDFRNDGYKRSKRALYEIDSPTQRYADIVRLYKAGTAARVDANWGDLTKVVIDATITNSGRDWNFDAHQTVDLTPTIDDFRKTVAEYLAWEVDRIVAGDSGPKADSASTDPELEALARKHAVRWAHFQVGGVGGLFTITPTAPLAKALPGDRAVPVISNTSANNGVIGYRMLTPNNAGNVITFSDTTDSMSTVFYQPFPFVGFAHVQAMTPVFDGLNRRRAMYFIAAFRAAIGAHYSYATKFNRLEASATAVSLPTNDGLTPAWGYMEEYIALLEARRLQALIEERRATEDTYLAAATLDSSVLDDRENATVDALKRGIVPFAEFDLVGDGGLFAFERGVRQTIRQRQPGATPLVTAGYENYGVAGLVASGRSSRFQSNTITIDMFSNVFYRDHEYFADDNIISLARPSASPSQMLFMASAMQRLQKRGYDKQFRVETLRKSRIALPVTQEGLPDWELMEVVVVAIQKLVVQDLVDHLDRRIDATRRAIASPR